MKKKVTPKDKRSKSNGKLRHLPPRKDPRGGAAGSPSSIIPCLKTATAQPGIRTT